MHAKKTFLWYRWLPVGLLLLIIGWGLSPELELGFALQTPQRSWEWNTQGSLEGWNPFFHLTDTAVTQGALHFTTTGDDAQFWSSNLFFDAASFPTFSIRLKLSGGPRQVDHGQLFWDNGNGFSEANSAHLMLLADGEFHTYQTHLSAIETWRGTIRRLRIDPSAGRAGVTGSIDSVRLNSDTIVSLDAPPIAELISVSAASEGQVTIAGQAGSVVGPTLMSVLNLHTGNTHPAFSQDDGSFSVQMDGFEHTPFLINAGTTGLFPFDPLNFDGSPATIVYNPTASADLASAATAGVSGQINRDGRYVADIALDHTAIGSRDPLTLEGTLRITSPVLDQALSSATATVAVDLILVPLNAGQPVGYSALKTPSGLGILSVPNSIHMGHTSIRSSRFSRDGDTLTVPFRLSRDTQFRLPDGYYNIMLSFLYGASSDSLEALVHSRLLKAPGDHPDIFTSNTPIPQLLPVVIKVGDPGNGRLPWVLLWNTPSQGSRGVIASEDQGRFSLPNKIVFGAKHMVVPMTDERSGETLVYRLEPFLPTLLANDKAVVQAPLVPLKLPSGQLSVRVEKPDGGVDDLGSAPFRQLRMGLALPMGERQHNHFGETSVVSPAELTTLSPQFEYAFTQYGRHIITMQGSIEDVNGNDYDGGGRYEVWVAKPLNVVEMGVFPGTPFEVGDYYSPTVRVEPGVPADVEVDFSLHINSSQDDVLRRVFNGSANRFGYFHPADGTEPLQIPAHGEYVVDVTASYWTSDGVLWMGSRRGANVVETPNAQLVAHGRRGMDRVSLPDRPQWFFYNNLDNIFAEQQVVSPLFTFPPPFHSGDVSWIANRMRDLIGLGEIAPVVRFQDLKGDISAEMVRRFVGYRHSIDGTISALAAAGETPLLTRPPISHTNPVPAPQDYRHWAYWYQVTDRPGVGVRAIINADDSHGGRLYWTFGDPYNQQPGNGNNGDLPNDIKLLFGGVVYRDLDKQINQYAIYGSMAVIVDNNDPFGERTAPPFRGAAGGLDGGPLLVVKGEEIDMFITPTGVRPGEVLEVNDSFSFAGQLWPLLPSLVNVAVTSPGGQVRQLEGRANKVGYFYQPDADFVVSEAGRWTVTVEVIHDGLTSAGPVEAPFPSGGVLGSQAGTYSFYVVPKEVQADLNLVVEFAQPAQTPLSLSGDLPAGLSQASVHYTVTMPGMILAQGTLPISDAQYAYTYDPVVLNKDFPNLDIRDRENEGPTPVSVDTITFTMFISGVGPEGDVFVARRALLQGEALIQVGAGTSLVPDDADGDGVPDEDDLCPQFPGRPETNGC